jgi:hypothetical protein
MLPARSNLIGSTNLGIERAHVRPVLTLWVAGQPLPWMLTDHTAGWPDLPRTLASWLLGHPIALSLGVLAAVAATAAAAGAGSRHGATAGILVGGWVATDPVGLGFFRTMEWHVGWQLLGLALLLHVVPRAWKRSAGALAPGALAGLLLHLKLTLLPVLGSIVLAALWVNRTALRSRIPWIGMAVLGFVLGFVPTLSAWALSARFPAPPPALALHDTATWQWERLRAHVRGQPSAGDLRKAPGLRRSLLAAPATTRAVLGLPPGTLDRAAGATPLLLLVPLGIAARRGEAQALATPAAVGLTALMHGEIHHLLGASWLATVASASGIVGRGIPIMLGLALVLRVASAVEIASDLDGTTTRTERVRALANDLRDRGLTEPLVLDYGLGPMLHALSDGEIRPWYAGTLDATPNELKPLTDCLLFWSGGVVVRDPTRASVGGAVASSLHVRLRASRAWGYSFLPPTPLAGRAGSPYVLHRLHPSQRPACRPVAGPARSGPGRWSAPTPGAQR